MALTNACELRCSYCYAPKQASVLNADDVVGWTSELDRSGCLGVGFGGGEPTLHPSFAQLCKRIASSTSMAVTFTTHGHRVTAALADQLRDSVHFVRLSVDGVGSTYQLLRGRPFKHVSAAAVTLASVAPIGINTVVNSATVDELDEIASFAESIGAVELLLLPQQATAGAPGIQQSDADRLIEWVRNARANIRIAIARSGLESLLPTVEVIPGEHPLDAHLHLDATGVLRPHAYSEKGRRVEASIMKAVDALKEEV